MVANGFADNAARIGVLQNDMQTVKQDVRSLKEAVGTLEDKVDTLEEKTDSLSMKTDSLTIKTDSLVVKTDSLTIKTDSLASGQTRILDILLNQTASRAEVRELDHRVVRLEQHLQLA
ncbi:MAG: hypothetical protein A2821_02605 [Candidatus Magasanikbacteria bacterium RIFCSPHIGHO2_01_FULL_41_23]|uniref:t-SNARE coiled-coil homology domain-containing protein n=1 Tax=Candidatus Magasanikbacteria bacterium RIFCSPLOWO2_01_FULL_40_15 TaxID=1798686 RepID=A0A1F6N2C7_9BACT|nr:MAG: hypothetical protein A2821_02605 [Candidatus Magasanikbacteria bacterium RIFCSPHIGHO2_01_FULL_41_23]OGH74882.1 MAG: hypothetical protein A3F22_04315 [Candidatus Magasanikbacteria bacterium RIFCSPHIGHO2_12_FULL_41_16]OGH78156.1 MAG: hypothetical protein A2983_03730 [Candidatus Magasanikbacteria bacterium RIFCSPLOWO2_01_FULL_40_15]